MAGPIPSRNRSSSGTKTVWPSTRRRSSVPRAPPGLVATLPVHRGKRRLQVRHPKTSRPPPSRKWWLTGGRHDAGSFTVRRRIDRSACHTHQEDLYAHDPAPRPAALGRHRPACDGRAPATLSGAPVSASPSRWPPRSAPWFSPPSSASPPCRTDPSRRNQEFVISAVHCEPATCRPSSRFMKGAPGFPQGIICGVMSGWLSPRRRTQGAICIARGVSHLPPLESQMFIKREALPSRGVVASHQRRWGNRR